MAALHFAAGFLCRRHFSELYIEFGFFTWRHVRLSVSLAEYGPDPSSRKTQLPEYGGPISECCACCGTMRYFFRHYNSIAGHKPEGTKISPRERMMLLPAHRRAIRAQDEFTAFITVSSRAASQPKIISHILPGFENEGVAIVDRPNYVHGGRTKRDQQAVSVFQHQIRQRVHAAGIGFKLQDDTACSFLSFHPFRQSALACSLRLRCRCCFRVSDESPCCGCTLSGFVQFADVLVQALLLVHAR